jgi:flagella basal body P-ring formation protein FlgA
MRRRSLWGIWVVALALLWGRTSFADSVSDEGLSGEARVVSVLESYVARRASTEAGSGLRVRLVNPADWNEILGEGDRLKVRESPQGVGAGRANFLMTVDKKDGQQLSRWVTADVEIVRSVVTAKYALKPFRVIEFGDIEVTSVYLSRKGAHYATKLEEIVGKKMRKSAEIGTPITFDMVQDVPVIHQGDRVTLMVESDGFEIVTAGEAKGDGFLGKQVAVINVDSQKMVYGKVLDAVTVQVGAR